MLQHTFFKKLLHLSLFLIPLFLMGQGTQEQFGQNRVQYKEFAWQYYQSANFITYFNQGGQSLGRFASQMAEMDLKEIEEMLDYKINRKVELMVYNTISDFNQSNIGVGNEQLWNTGGRTRIIGNKVFVYFNGSHADLRRQLREGIARVLVSSMVFGGNLQEIVQNAVLLNLPDWFVDGLVSYIGQNWSSEMDNRLRDGILSGRYEKFNRLFGEDARFAGHSLWYYIAENHGESNIPNLLYLIRVNRSLENGFLFVLGSTVSQTIDDWYNYFFGKYAGETADRQQPKEENIIKKRYRKNRVYHDLKLSPDGKHIAYVTDELGRWKVRILNIEDNKEKVVKKGGFKTRSIARDYSYPILAWTPKGDELAVIFEKRAKTQLFVFDAHGKKQNNREIARFQKVIDASYANDGKTIVMSAMSRGYSDIYTYFIPNARLLQITNDFYDDLSPNYVKLDNREGILFASNRDSDTLKNAGLDSLLPVGTHDLYFYDLKKKSKVLLQVTHTGDALETSPVQLDSVHFGYLSDMNGIQNRFAGYIDTTYSHTDTLIYFADSTIKNPDYDLQPFIDAGMVDSSKLVDVYKDTAIIFPVTNYASNIIEHDAVPKLGKSVEMFLQNNRYEFYLSDIPDDLPASAQVIFNTSYRSFAANKSAAARETGVMTIEVKISEEEQEEQPRDSIEYPGHYFQSPFDPTPASKGYKLIEVPISTTTDKSNLLSTTEFKRTTVQPYKTKYSTEYVLSQIDNSLYINKYESFTGFGGSFSSPDLNVLFTISTADLFEDYRFTGGFRFPTSFSGSEFYLAFDDVKKRLDKKYLFYHSSEGTAYNFEPAWFNIVSGKVKTNILQSTLKWPFDVLRSARGYFTYRNDKVFFQATDTFSLNLPTYRENWLAFRLEYVFDNTYEVSTNILNGMRYKFWVETQKPFRLNTGDGFDFGFEPGILATIGVDFRHYQRVHRQMIWANRFAAATSFGKHKIVYYLGGVDSWLLPDFSTEVEIDRDAGYAFQTLATNMRGFPQNIRNGNSFAVWNSELRVPLFTYIFNRPIRSEIIRNFQVVGFFDVGTAWQGLSPFDEDNPFNVETINQDPVTVTVKHFRNPVVAGYGVGLRTLLFGYFIRTDVAWGIDSGVVNDPVWYFSLSLDF